MTDAQSLQERPDFDSAQLDELIADYEQWIHSLKCQGFGGEFQQQKAIDAINFLRGALAKLEEEKAELRDVLLRKGFIPCDIAACNCGSWHHRYGLPERMQEIKDVLYEADVLNNDTGNLPLNAIQKLIEQRDALQSRLAEYEKQPVLPGLLFVAERGARWSVILSLPNGKELSVGDYGYKQAADNYLLQFARPTTEGKEG